MWLVSQTHFCNFACKIWYSYYFVKCDGVLDRRRENTGPTGWTLQVRVCDWQLNSQTRAHQGDAVGLPLDCGDNNGTHQQYSVVGLYLDDYHITWISAVLFTLFIYYFPYILSVCPHMIVTYNPDCIFYRRRLETQNCLIFTNRGRKPGIDENVSLPL